MTTSIRLESEIERKLETLARKTGRTKTWYIRQAIREYLEEWEDFHLALTRLEKERGEIDLKEVRRRLGLGSRGKLLVAVPRRQQPPLAAAAVEAVTEALREQRGQTRRRGRGRSSQAP